MLCSGSITNTAFFAPCQRCRRLCSSHWIHQTVKLAAGVWSGEEGSGKNRFMYGASLRFVFAEIFRLQVLQPLVKLFGSLLANHILIRENRRIRPKRQGDGIARP